MAQCRWWLPLFEESRSRGKRFRPVFFLRAELALDLVPDATTSQFVTHSFQETATIAPRAPPRYLRHLLRAH